MINPFSDEYFMKEAFKEAEIALEKDEVPVGAVIVLKSQIIGRGHNLILQFNDVTAHDDKRCAGNFNPSIYHPKTKIESGLMQLQAEVMLKEFFAKKR